ncbi:MAG: type II toxin-antitoxin system VapC family toxin, partial [bacterium]|nr:type II toxin-antitoxin system VapC family toxin [bacterium]
ILAGMNILVATGLKPVDALHVACAAALDCKYFLTVDKGILKKAADISIISIINPVDFIIEWEEKL